MINKWIEALMVVPTLFVMVGIILLESMDRYGWGSPELMFFVVCFLLAMIMLVTFVLLLMMAAVCYIAFLEMRGKLGGINA